MLLGIVTVVCGKNFNELLGFELRYLFIMVISKVTGQIVLELFD